MSCSIDTVHGTFDYDRPTPEQIDVRDIARALSMTCRWGGHVTRFLSVAEHALSVSRLVADRTGNRAMAFAALHHDSHEAYLGDAPTPLKVKMGEAWEEIVRPVDAAIAEAFGIWPALLHHRTVKQADQDVMVWEAALVKTSGAVLQRDGVVRSIDPAELPGWFKQPLGQLTAEAMFLQEHERLCS